MWLKYSSQQLLRPSAIAVLVFCLLLLLLRPSVYLPQVPHFFGKIVGCPRQNYAFRLCKVNSNQVHRDFRYFVIKTLFRSSKVASFNTFYLTGLTTHIQKQR